MLKDQLLLKVQMEIQAIIQFLQVHQLLHQQVVEEEVQELLQVERLFQVDQVEVEPNVYPLAQEINLLLVLLKEILVELE